VLVLCNFHFKSYIYFKNDFTTLVSEFEQKNKQTDFSNWNETFFFTLARKLRVKNPGKSLTVRENECSEYIKQCISLNLEQFVADVTSEKSNKVKRIIRVCTMTFRHISR
jgi:hypothetical protein